MREMYRLYNSNTGEHFYTANSGEKDELSKIGWQYECIGWYAPEKSKTAVYRLYNKYGGEHHYTVNKAEKDALVKAGWTDDGIGWYSDDNKTVALYREYNPNARSCNHNYTTNRKEHEALIGMGWNNEGTAWYGAAEGKPVVIEKNDKTAVVLHRDNPLRETPSLKAKKTGTMYRGMNFNIL